MPVKLEARGIEQIYQIKLTADEQGDAEQERRGAERAGGRDHALDVNVCSIALS
jgi:hypothetical protein